MQKTIQETDLLNALSLDDKLSLLAGKSLFKTRAIPKLGLPAMKLVDGPRGVGFHSSLKRCTAFPTGIALGASWNRALAQEFGKALAQEVIAVGGHVLLGPAVNICRTPLNGRTFEYLTEDPLLNSQLTVPLIQGVQSQGVAACIKHFAVNNQERSRSKISAEVSERALREIYLPVFEAAVRDADVWSVMAAYNAVNGVAACENEDLLKERLRKEFGFSGFVMSDWFAARRTESGASCLKAGLNLEMPGSGSRFRKSRLKKEFQAGAFTEQDLDEALLPLLRIWRRVATLKKEDGQRNSWAHQELAYRMAADSITLLKNEKNLLPLLTPNTADNSAHSDSMRRVAVLGPRAKKRNCRPLYGGSAGVWSPYEITPLEGIQNGLPEGYTLTDDVQQADAAIVVVGLGHRVKGDCEGKDRVDMKLPQEQEQLIRDTAAINPNTIVVLISGSPLEMDWSNEVNAIVAAWYPGMEGGRALADILFGRINPSGKLPVTFPRRLSDSPAHKTIRQYPGVDNKVHYDEGVFVGYRHFDFQKQDVLFPFGHGLTYTEFNYSQLNSPKQWKAGEALPVNFDLRNVGNREGTEIVQLYIAPAMSNVKRPPKELKAFSKEMLLPGESRNISFTLPERALAYWCEEKHQWQVDEGQYGIWIGSSSQDIRLYATVEYQYEYNQVETNHAG